MKPIAKLACLVVLLSCCGAETRSGTVFMSFSGYPMGVACASVTSSVDADLGCVELLPSTGLSVAISIVPARLTVGRHKITARYWYGDRCKGVTPLSCTIRIEAREKEASVGRCEVEGAL